VDVALYQRAKAVFDAVVDLSPEARGPALASACGEDPQLRSLVDELLALDEGETPVDEPVGAIDRAAARLVAPPLPLQPGREVDRYVVLRLLGVGGTAQVWEVHHRTLGSTHALKVLTWADPSLQRRLLREARAQAQLDHPHIVPVHDVVEVNGAPGLLMPLIEGPALDELLAEYSPTGDEVVALVCAIAEGVAHAHRRGFAHRDLKPGNVLLDLRGDRVTPRVADFGLVKGGRDLTHTRPGAVMGTLTYAAPEQLADSRGADARADLWSLGVMLYELTTGERPFRGRTLRSSTPRRPAPTSRPCRRRCGTSCPTSSWRIPRSASTRARRCWRGSPSRPRWRGTVPSPAWPGTWRRSGWRAARPPRRSPRRRTRRCRRSGRTRRPAARSPWPGPRPPAPDPRPAPPRGPLIAVAAAVALVAGGVWWGLSPAAPPAPAPPSPTAEPPAPAPASVAPAPDPAPVVSPAPAPPSPAAEPPASAPASVAPASVAAPAPAPVATPAPVTAPAPAAAPAAAPAPGPDATDPWDAAAAPAPAASPPGVVRLDGTVEQARLVGGDGRVRSPGAVPPGEYTFEARLPDRGNWVTLKLGPVRSGETVTVRCDAQFCHCKVVSRSP
jgi:hypothetical protein